MSNAKLNASIEACEYVRANIDINSIIGVGTGTTVNYFIEELAKIKTLFKGAVSSSEFRGFFKDSNESWHRSF